LQHITSKDNSVIKEIRKIKEKKYRTEKGIFIVEGFRFLEEALKSSFQVESIFFSEG